MGFAATVYPQNAQAQHPSEARTIGDAKAPEQRAGCALPSEPWGVPSALDAAISGPADADRACMKALLTPDARITLVSIGADGATTYKILTLDDWIARTKVRGHVTLEEKQLNFRIDRFGNIAHLWSLYALRSGGQAVARGINSIQAIKDAGGSLRSWCRPSQLLRHCPRNICRKPTKCDRHPGKFECSPLEVAPNDQS